MNIIFIMLFLLPSTIFANVWDLNMGNSSDLINLLNSNMGRSQIYNCELLIESLDLNDERVYFITIIDEFAQKSATINMSFKERNQKHHTNNFQLILENHKHFYSKFNIKNRLNKKISEISFVEINTLDFELYRAIKCSKNGRNF